MKKQILSILLALSLVFSLSACGKKEDAPETKPELEENKEEDKKEDKEEASASDLSEEEMEEIYQDALAYEKDSKLFAAQREFNKIKGYKDVDEKLIQITYDYGKDLMRTRNYEKAVKEFSKIEDFKDSKDLILEAKYEHVKKYPYKANYTTEEFVKELVEINYKDIKEIEKNLK